MSEMTHTPGPWIWDDQPWLAQSAPWLIQAANEIHTTSILRGEIRCESEADAYLIAAAPELLEALQAVLEARKSYERFGEICSFEENPMIYAQVLIELAEKAEIAINKATKRTSGL